MATVLVISLGVPAALSGQEPSTPTVGDGEYALAFSPPFQSLDVSGRAFAVILDQGVHQIVFCRPETGEGGGSIGFSPASNDFTTGEWTVGDGGSSLARLTVMLHSRDRSTQSTAQFDVGLRWGSKGTLTMRGFQDGFLVGSLTGEGTSVTSGSEQREPVRVALSFRARSSETDNLPDCY